jgi:DNA-binding response OmpR family regulator
MPSENAQRRVAVIIEDDADIRNLLEAVLAQAGFEVIATGNGLDGIAAVRAYDPIVTTLDVSMPGIDGFETAKRIRVFSPTYLVMLTARDDEIDTLQGLESGADDYVTKPFRPRELRARIEAMLRRPRQPITADAAAPTAAPDSNLNHNDPHHNDLHHNDPPASDVPASKAPDGNPPALQPVTPPSEPAPTRTAPVRAFRQTPVASAPVFVPAADAASPVIDAAPLNGWFEHNSLRLNPAERLVQLSGDRLDLTRTEFDLLAALLESQRRVHSLNDLALLLRGEAHESSDPVNDADRHAVEVHLGDLRRKLGDSSATPRWLETVHGGGYRLAAHE